MRALDRRARDIALDRTGTDPAIDAVPRLRARFADPGAPSPAPGPDDTTPLLVARAQDGDVGAWSRLYQDSFDALFKHVCFLTGDPLVAEDLVQEAFARAFTSIQRFDGRAGFKSWIRGIALNVVRMHWRRAQTTDRVHQNLARMRSVTSNAAGDPDRAHQQEVRMQVLYEVLRTLPEHFREAFILRDIEGLTLAEAAAELGVTSNNVAVRATRARAKIREALVELGWLSEEDA